MELEKQLKTKEVADLYKAILILQNPDECSKFFRDLLTLEEIEEATRRWKVAKMLSDNKSFLEISDETKMSSATIARVNFWIHHGMGGYKLMFNRLGLIKSKQDRN